MLICYQETITQYFSTFPWSLLVVIYTLWWREALRLFSYYSFVRDLLVSSLIVDLLPSEALIPVPLRFDRDNKTTLYSMIG